MKTSITLKIGTGFMILLITMLSTYFINMYIQNQYKNFEKDFEVFQNFTNNFNQFLQTQGNFYIKFDKQYYDDLFKRYNYLKNNYNVLLKTKNYKSSKKVRNNVDIIKKNIDVLMQRYEYFFSITKDYDLSNLYQDNDTLSPQRLDLKLRVKDLIVDINEKEIIGTEYTSRSEVIIINLDSIFIFFSQRKQSLDKNSKTVTNIVALTGILISLLISGYILYRLRNSIQKLISFVHKISEGDFTAKVDIREKDETQLLAENIRKIVSFETILIEIRKLTRTLNLNYNQIRETIYNFHDSIKNQAESLKEASVSFDELTTSLSEVARNSLNTKNITLETKNKTHASSLQIQDTISDIKVLAASASKIMGIVKIINALTTQTELLSLNAAIEASRAGVSSKGFNVVASEIRKLAETSSDATKQISQLAREIVIKLRQTTKKSEISVDALKMIEDSIEDVSSFIEEITDITEKESYDSKNILKAVSEISEMTKLNTENAMIISENNLLLRDELDKLNKLLNRFRLSDTI